MKLDKRQKILITLIVIAFAYVAWQLYDMFGGGDGEVAPAPAPVTHPVQPVRPAVTAPTSVAPSATTTAPVAVRPTLTPVQPTSTATGPVEQPLMVAPSTAYQRQYVQLLNQYHLTKLQRQVIDEQVAIANAQARIAQINVDTQKLGGVTTSALTSNISSTASTSSGYKLVYIDNQAGKWTATLSQNGNLIEVNTGDVLADGTEILGISQRGVLVNRRGTRYLISFNGISVARGAEAKSPNVESSSRLNNNLFTLKPVVKTVEKTTTTPTTTTTQTTVTTAAPAPAKPLFTLTPPTTTTTTTTAAIPSIANNKTTATVTTTTNPTTGNTATTITVPSSKPAQATTTNVTVSKTITAPVTAEKTTTVTATTAVPAASASASAAKSTTTVTTVTAPTPAPAPTAMTTLNNQQVASNFNLTPQQQTKVAELATNLNNTNTAKQTYTDAEKALLAIPSDYYTVQLMGSRKESDLTNMIKQYSLKNTYIFQTTYLEHPWFVLVYGSFKTEQAANTAIKQLPTGIQQIKPWVRPMLSVHNAIKR